MKKNTKKLIIAISIIAIIVILIVVGVLLFLTTDLFKSDKELFLKYAAQNGEMISAYLENKNAEEINLVNSSKYSTKGTVTFDLVSNDTEIANRMLPARNFSIDFEQQVDPSNSKDSSQISLKFLNENLFTLKYAHNQDLYAITSDEVINKYLAVDNNNLKELAQKYGVTDVTNIPNKIKPVDFSKLFEISDEDAKYIAQTYINVINNSISEESYYSNKDVTIEVDGKQVVSNCYGISLTADQYKSVIINLLNQLQQDDRTLNILIEKVKCINDKLEITLTDMKETISKIISDLQDSNEFKDTKIEVYEFDKKLVRTVMESGHKETIDYQKTENSVRILLTNEYNEDNTNIETNSTNKLNDNLNINTVNGNSLIGNTVSQGEQFINSTTPTTNAKDLTQMAKFKLKSIEMAKQEQEGESNTVAILTFETGNNKNIKVSIQEKMNQDTQSQAIKNNLTINISDADTTNFEITIDSTKTPSNDVKVEELNTENSAIVNNFSPEYTMSLIQAISNRLQKLFNDKMQIIATVQAGSTQITNNQTNTIIGNGQ